MVPDDEAPKAAAPKAEGSRLLRKGGDSDSGSDTESESEEESMSEDGDKGKKRSRFLRTDATDEDSSDEDSGKRVVKSARDKRLEEMEGSGKQMDNALKINDWVAVSNGEYSIDRFGDGSTNDCRVRQACAYGSAAAECSRACASLLSAHPREPGVISEHGCHKGERSEGCGAESNL